MLHCGRSTGGQYLYTLSAVDIASGWWEGEAITSRSQEATKEGMQNIRSRLPFRILEVHPDNDTGMINDLLWRYCKSVGIKMSRSRPYKKNDNAWVEQKNWTHVRKVAGYERLDTTAELAILRELYSQVTLYKNYFQPAIKLIEKLRVNGRIHRKYDEPKTPYQRLLDSGQVKPEKRKVMEAQYESLNVAELHRRIEQLRTRLFETTLAKVSREPVAPTRRGPGIRIEMNSDSSQLRRLKEQSQPEPHQKGSRASAARQRSRL